MKTNFHMKRRVPGLALKKRPKPIASTIKPAGKASFVYSCMQTRLMAQYNDKWPISLVCVSKPLMTATTAIATLAFLSCLGAGNLVHS